MYCKEPLSLIACHVIATKLTDKQIRRGIFYSVPELIQAIKNFVKVDNNDSVPFVWTAQFNPSWKRSIVVKPFMQHNTSDCRGEKLPT